MNSVRKRYADQETTSDHVISSTESSMLKYETIFRLLTKLTILKPDLSSDRRKTRPRSMQSAWSFALLQDRQPLMESAVIQRQYDDVIASQYDQDPQNTTGNSLNRALDHLESEGILSGALPAMKVLDVGHGNRHVSGEAASQIASID